jgi:endonuclease-3 related protein
MTGNSFELLTALKRAGYLHTARDPFWWPRSGSEEVIFGAILTQQTKWERVEESLQALREHNLCSLDALAGAEPSEVAEYIKPSGFYNTKAQRLILLARNILNDFSDFEIFRQEVDRTWLLSQKGIGMESADSILCYACHRPVMVVDSYTARVLEALGYTFENYMQIQAWMHEGIEEHWESVRKLYGYDISPAGLYARFHGKIVEFAKVYIRGKKVDVSVLLSPQS